MLYCRLSLDHSLQNFCDTNKSCEKMTSPSLSPAFDILLEASDRKLCQNTSYESKYSLESKQVSKNVQFSYSH